MSNQPVEISDNIELLVNNTYIHSSGKHAIALIFLCRWKSGEPQSLEDTINVEWISAKEFDDLEFAPNVKNYIIRGFTALKD